MKTQQIFLNENILELYVKPSSKSAIFISYSISIVFIVLPILFIILAVADSDEDGPPFGLGMFLFIAISVFIGLYFLRFAFWNHFGKEVYMINENECFFYSDYKYYKENNREIQLNDYYFDIIEIQKEYYLYFSNGEEILQSAIKLPENDLVELVNEINARLNSKRENIFNTFYHSLN